MFDFGFPELILIIAVAVLVLGPNEIPGVMRFFGRIVRRLQYIRFAMTQQFDDFMQDVDVNDLRLSAKSGEDTDPALEKDHDEESVKDDASE